MLHLAIVTGPLVSELTALTRADICLRTGPHVTCHAESLSSCRRYVHRGSRYD
jgi:hypothetical protein